mgnify:CR=1 FL=1
MVKMILVDLLIACFVIACYPYFYAVILCFNEK